MGRWHIKIEGTDEIQGRKFFEEIQNKYSLYDNCVFEEIDEEDSFISEEDRCCETGNIICKRPINAGKETEVEQE